MGLSVRQQLGTLPARSPEVMVADRGVFVRLLMVERNLKSSPSSAMA